MKVFALHPWRRRASLFAHLLVALLLFNQFAATAAHSLPGDDGRVPVCTTTGIKWVVLADDGTTPASAHQAAADHCVLCTLPPPRAEFSFQPIRAGVADHECPHSAQTALRTNLYRGFQSLSRSPPTLS